MSNRLVGVVGLGLLGRGIAACLLFRGLRVVGAYWAEPCHLTRFLELIRGEQIAAADLPKLLQELIKSGAVGIADRPGCYTHPEEEALDWQRWLTKDVLKVRERNTELFLDEALS